VLNRPELVIEEETIDFKVQEQKNDKLPAGETRVLQEGRQGIRVHLIEVENGKRTEKDSYDKVMAQDRIVEVGTAGETTKPVQSVATKPIDSSEASQTNKAQLPNTGSAASQAAVAAGLALLGLSAGLVATKGKKED
jgi:beta-galactosidase